MKTQEGRLLNRAMQNAQMGVVGIDSILPRAKSAIRPALERQKKEYIHAACSARRLMKSYGEQPKNVSHASAHMADWMGRMRTMTDDSPSTMAAMMIRGSAMGTISLQRELNRCKNPDKRAQSLSQELLKTEEANINELKPFL